MPCYNHITNIVWRRLELAVRPFAYLALNDESNCDDFRLCKYILHDSHVFHTRAKALGVYYP